MYNIESRITDEDRSFASQLTDLIKDAINFDIFKETYDTEDVSEVVQDDTKFREIVDIDYKKRVIEFWRFGQKKRRNIESVRNRFKKVINVTQLYRWEAQVAEGESRTDKLLYTYFSIRFRTI